MKLTEIDKVFTMSAAVGNRIKIQHPGDKKELKINDLQPKQKYMHDNNLKA